MHIEWALQKLGGLGQVYTINILRKKIFILNMTANSKKKPIMF